MKSIFKRLTENASMQPLNPGYGGGKSKEIRFEAQAAGNKFPDISGLS
jgi:hypothetical protein